jgi:hypothetical protein
VAAAGPAFAEWGGDATSGGSRLSFYERKELQQIKRAAAEAAAAKAATRYEYASVANCGSNTPDTPVADNFCKQAVLACAGNTPQQGLGPSVKLYRREVEATGAPQGPWELLGTTCFPQDAPGAPARALTMAMVQAAFHDTAFARPSLNVQPKGNVTLVTLPTYFELAWPQAGFQPGEVDRPDPARVLGFDVEIRPLLESVVYVYGDGSTSGPTTSGGGPYPRGDIRKAYDEPGTFPVRADVTYRGQFRVDGGEWIDIPGTVTVQGTPEDLQVKTAHARLVSH